MIRCDTVIFDLSGTWVDSFSSGKVDWVLRQMARAMVS